jgi:NAD(P)-dependent dehydrogenase (short-subunit alcohol dehydrogenase family)
MSTRTAVIIGATGGIGRACAEALGDHGYEFLLTGRREDVLQEVAGGLQDARCLRVDLSNEEDVATLAERVDLLVHAAGIMEGTYLRRQSRATFDRVMESNLRSAYLVTEALLPKMQAGSRAIYISSTSGLKGMPGLTAYSAAKAGLHAFAQALAGEVERDGISVHLVTPAPVDTAMLDRAAHAMAVLKPQDVGDVVRWLDTLPPLVVIRDIVMRAVTQGPFATEFSRGGGSDSPAAPVGRH